MTIRNTSSKMNVDDGGKGDNGRREDERWSVELRKADDRFVPIRKADELKQIVYGIVLEPHVADTDRDYEEPEDIEAAAHRYLLKSRTVKFPIDAEHKQDVDAAPVESAIARTDFWFPGTPETDEYKVKKGSWYMGVKVFDKNEFQKVLRGEYAGFSIGGWGRRTRV